MTDDGLDLDTLVDVLDKAMTSENPAVRAALKELVLAVALTTGEGRERLVDGPLKSLLMRVHRLESKLGDMERKQWTRNHSQDDKKRIAQNINWVAAKKWNPPEIDFLTKE